MRARRSTLEQIKRDHTPQRIDARLTRAPRQAYLRDWVYGGIDGAVTTFAVVSGVTGANLEDRVIIILGLANLVGDGFSMAAANYLGTRTETEQAKRLEAAEKAHMELWPEGQRDEIRQILSRIGLWGEVLERAVGMLSSDRTKSAKLIVSREFGNPTSERSPKIAAGSTFSAFLICGFVPLMAYIMAIDSPFVMSSTLTAFTFFGIGSLRSRWSLVAWWKSGLSTLAVGGTAALLAYVVGALIKGVT